MSTLTTGQPYAVTEEHPEGQATVKGAGWQLQGECKNYDPELFFPVGHTGPALKQIQDAKQVCFKCTVASDCLNWALNTGQDAGVWGGMSEDERRELKRRGYGRNK